MMARFIAVFIALARSQFGAYATHLYLPLSPSLSLVSFSRY